MIDTQVHNLAISLIHFIEQMACTRHVYGGQQRRRTLHKFSEYQHSSTKRKACVSTYTEKELWSAASSREISQLGSLTLLQHWLYWSPCPRERESLGLTGDPGTCQPLSRQRCDAMAVTTPAVWSSGQWKKKNVISTPCHQTPSHPDRCKYSRHSLQQRK